MSAQLSRDDWKSRIGGLSYRNQAFIGGKFAPSLAGKTFDCINPATGQMLTKVAACEQADVDAAVKAARAAFDKGTWANMPPAQRKRIMLKLAELMMKNREELALLETLDMGKPIAFSTTVDIPGSANTVQWFAEAIDKIYAEAGIPDGVFNVLPGFGETAGQALGRHMDVDVIAFTGSTEVGKYFLRYSGESNMKQVWLECGGKSPNIVLADAPNLDIAARRTAFGIWFNQGEVCTAGSRLIVEDKIKDSFLEKVMAIGQKMMPGDPLDPKTQMGAMVDETQTQRVMGYIEAGQKEGAKLRMGGKQVHVDNAGSFIEPTVFDGVDNKMKIAQEEIFGPVLSVISVKDSEQALSVANDTIYGLASAIFTSDINKAFKFAKGLRAGSVWVNTYDGGDITTPFGGYKQSGIGRDKSLHAFDKFTQVKTTWIQLG